MQVRVSPEIGTLLDDAVSESLRRGKYYVGVEHLFEAVLGSVLLLPQSFVDKYIDSLESTRGLLHHHGWAGEPPTVGGEPYYTPRCATAIREASRLAERLNCPSPSVGHVLLAILCDAHALPSRVLDECGRTRKELISDLRASLLEHPGSNVQPTATPAPVAAIVPTPTQESASDDLPPVPESALEELTRDLTAEASQGLINRAVGRSTEIASMVEVLARQSKSNVIIVGEAGVGKTKIVEGAAVLFARGKFDDLLGPTRILELNIASLMSGTKYRGAFEEKVQRLIEELENATDTILFIDEMHLVMGAGATDGDGMDLANLLKPALGRGRIRCIGATTFQEYRKFISKDPALERRFQVLRVEELSSEATYKVLKSMTRSFETHHRVAVTDDAIDCAIRLTERYLPNRSLPDKAIDAIDQACARLRMKAVLRSRKTRAPQKEARKLSPQAIRKVVSQMSGVPLEEITAEERLQLTHLAAHLNARVIGQDEAVATAVSVITKSRAGLANPDRPDAVMLFLGPTGVGKTQLAKEMAASIFGSKEHLISFDMSEYTEAHSVSRLIGSPPGYVGSEEAGRLSAAVQDTPFAVILFDEIEKAHPNVFDVLLPVLDEGRLFDAKGREVSFRNTTIIFTSNAAADQVTRGEHEGQRSQVLDSLRESFRPEFINRIDEIVPFYPLLFEDVRTILRVMIDDVRRRLKDKGIGLRMYQGAYEFLAEEGYSAEFGARELQRAVEKFIANGLSERLVANEFEAGDMIDVLMEEGELTFRKGKPKSKPKESAA